MIEIIHINKSIFCRIVSLIVVIVMLLSQLSNISSASENFVTLDISKGNIVITSTGYSQNSSKEIPYTGKYILTGSTTKNSVDIKSGTIYVVLKNLNIDLFDSAENSAFTVDPDAVANLMLSGINKLKGGIGYSGLNVLAGAKVIIGVNADSSSHIINIIGGGSKLGSDNNMTAGDGIGGGGLAVIESGVVNSVGGSVLYGNAGAGVASNVMVDGGMIISSGGSAYRGSSGVGINGDLSMTDGFGDIIGGGGYTGGRAAITGNVFSEGGYLIASGGAGAGAGKAVLGSVKLNNGMNAFTSSDCNTWAKADEIQKLTGSQYLKIQKSEPSGEFTDVPYSSWYFEAVEFATHGGLLDRVTESTFKPTNTAARSEIVTALYRLAGCHKTSASVNFTDVINGTEMSDAISWANKNSIAVGYGNGKFGPNDPITREQFAAMMFNFAKWKGIDVNKSDDLSEFVDASIISDWAKPSLQWAVSIGIIKGNGSGKLNPLDYITRAEVAAILMRFIENYI
ncbi:S-layer homology domain-containing protein [Thermoanaerobacterium butyriciformans]|uniref:SLH domain-containing protein n=1 Tax=Thermoanaerobacterium butyriciformans TaxID=1702242 RepID=A0ABS4NF48_9THEO|nr:S-layer homology domain-containing protein [Thermoanaerobacterium butyriciformans]MBP2072299.1 hypothetical protein [Thermoanaerobacterium butyriciformans]